MNVLQSTRAYEDWLRVQLGGDFVEKDLDTKHGKMRDGPFPFLRATYWRWAETILDICPQFADAPRVLAVGDIHLENYGTWRDSEGRLVWGVNDFDEAADMPYALDLLRLATSALLARPPHVASAEDICAAILEGYRKGLKNPRPYVLDQEHGWLRELVVVPETERAAFWDKMKALAPPCKLPPEPYRAVLQAALPDRAIALSYAPRTAGSGSLGRPRWVGMGEWRGGPILREAKALVPSGWVKVPGRGPQKLRCGDIAAGRFRTPDPWYRVEGTIVVRRLSPNNHKIEVKKDPTELLGHQMLVAMGHELANLHLGSGDHAAPIDEDLGKRNKKWLHEAVKAAVEFVAREYSEWKG